MNSANGSQGYPDYRCPLCDSRFKRYKDVARHIKACFPSRGLPPGPTWTCAGCKADFPKHFRKRRALPALLEHALLCVGSGGDAPIQEQGRSDLLEVVVFRNIFIPIVENEQVFRNPGGVHLGSTSGNQTAPPRAQTEDEEEIEVVTLD